MTISLTHNFVSPITDLHQADIVGPDEWNANHTVTGTPGTVMGFDVDGNLTELTAGSGDGLIVPDPTGTINYYVATTGSDTTGDGSIGNPWLTPDFACQYVRETYNTAVGPKETTGVVQINIGPGTYGGRVHLDYLFNVNIIGAGDTTIFDSISSGIFRAFAPCMVGIGSFKIQNTIAPGVGVGVYANSGGAVIFVGNINFGTGLARHIAAEAQGSVVMSGAGASCTISGGANNFAFAGSYGFIDITHGPTITLVGTPHFSHAFAWASDGTIFIEDSTIFVGSATGVRFIAAAGGQIGITDGGSASPTFLPGDEAGYGSTLGAYDATIVGRDVEWWDDFQVYHGQTIENPIVSGGLYLADVFNSNGTIHFGSLRLRNDDITGGSEDTSWHFSHIVAGAQRETLLLNDVGVKVTVGADNPLTIVNAAGFNQINFKSGQYIQAGQTADPSMYINTPATNAGVYTRINGDDFFGVIQGAIVPGSTNDHAAIGSGSLSWSDLFLASGGVINFNNGDVLLTHSTNSLAVTGATSYSFDGNVSITGGKALKLTGSTSGTVTIQTQGVAGTYTLTLPNTAGTNGNLLTTDGTGGLSWSAPGSASISIGSAISGGTAGRVLFEGAGPVLADSTNLTWSGTTLSIIGKLAVGNPTVVSGDDFNAGPLSTVSYFGTGTYDSGGGGLNVNAYAYINNFNNDSYGDGFSMQYARGTRASPTVVQSGDAVGSVAWIPYDGVSYIVAASISALMDGTASTNDVPTRIVFGTTPDGSNTQVERLRIDNLGRVTIGGYANQVVDNFSDTTMLQIVTTGSSPGTQLGLINYQATSDGVFIEAMKSRATAPGSFAAAHADDQLFTLVAGGDNGTSLMWSAYIEADVDGTPDGNPAHYLPTRWIFGTSNGVDFPQLRLTIASNGNVSITNSNGLFFESGDKIDWAAGNVTITHATNALTINSGADTAVLLGRWPPATSLNAMSFNGTFTNGSMSGFLGGGSGDNNFYIVSPFDIRLRPTGATTNKYIITDTIFTPGVNDGASLGTTTTSWSDLFLAGGGVINWNNGNITFTQSTNTLKLSGTTTIFEVIATDAGNIGPVLNLRHSSASPAAFDQIAEIAFHGKDSGGNDTKYGRWASFVPNVTDGAESADMIWGLQRAGAMTDVLVLLNTALMPNANDDLTLGTTANQWSDLFLASGGVINFNNGNSTITHDNTNGLLYNAPTGGGHSFKINSATVAIINSLAFYPNTDDGLALGATGNKWSDLFLADGAVVNFNNGDVLLTHSTNKLAATGATNYSFDGTVLPSANDAAALGTATVSWSDVFLATGAVINFNNGNLTLTHAATNLTIAGGSLTLAAGTATAAPLIFTAGSNLTTAADGAMEFDGQMLYFSPDGTDRRIVATSAYIRQHAAYVLSNSTTNQKLFNSSTNGQVLLPTGTYRFNCMFSISGMSATSGNAAFSVAAGSGATVTNGMMLWTAIDATTTPTAGAAFQSGMVRSVTGPTNLATATTATEMQAYVTGTFEVSVAGQVIPSIALVTGITATNNIGSFFECWKLGATTDTNTGKWS